VKQTHAFDTAKSDFAPIHHAPQDLRDRFALRLVKLMRIVPDMFFAKRYGHRAVVLETVAAVPGMVGGLFDPPHPRGPRLDQGIDRRSRQ